MCPLADVLWVSAFNDYVVLVGGVGLDCFVGFIVFDKETKGSVAPICIVCYKGISLHTAADCGKE
jgi:hypothetical protein